MNPQIQADGGNTSDGFNSSRGEGNGWQSSSGHDNDITQQQSAWGAGDTALNTDHITNFYVENPYEVNVFDNAYTETFSTPNPTSDYSSSSGFELE